MLKRILIISSGVAALGFASGLQAGPRTYQLPKETAAFKPGPDVEIARNNCGVCHSADYIRTQPPQRGKAFWTAEVNKMVKVFGAQVSPDDAVKIASYLAATY